MVAPVWAFESYQLWQRIYDKRVITDEGVYAEGQVPIAYAGPELEINFAQILIFANGAGEFREFRVNDYYDLKDADGNTGMGWSYQIYGTTIFEAPLGPSALSTTWYLEKIPNVFDGAEDSRIEILFRRYLEDRGDVPVD